MPLRFGINGLGRVGRALLRVAHERPEIELGAVNDVVPVEILARLLARDSVHGPFAQPVASSPGSPGTLSVGGREIAAFAEPEPERIPWADAGVEVVVEATGRFLRRDLAAGHLGGTVRTAIVSANAPGVDLTLCLGVNEERFDPRLHTVISNASCTTNCLALVAKVLHDRCGVERAMMSTVHPYTESQRLLDQPHADPRRSRSAALNIIPIPTTAPAALGEILPALAGRVDGVAIRVPTASAAMLDLVAEVARPATIEELRTAFREAAAGPLAGLLGATDEELVSSDFVGDPRSAVVDLPLMQAAGDPVEPSGRLVRLVRVIAWYDNEWGYAHRLADLLVRLASL